MREEVPSPSSLNSRSAEADTLLLGLGLPDDNAHSPNEKWSLGLYQRDAHECGTLANLAAHS